MKRTKRAVVVGALLLALASWTWADGASPRLAVYVVIPAADTKAPLRVRAAYVVFYAFERTVSVLDLVIYDGDGREVTNFRRPHGRSEPQLPLNVEPDRPLLVTIELSEDQLARARMLEWEEGDGTKRRIGLRLRR